MLQLFYSKKRSLIFLTIFLIAFIQRGSTLFVEFYDVDELTDVIMTGEIVDGGKPYIDAIPSRPVLFAFYYVIFKVFGSGNIIALHFVTILWVIGTCYLLYKINTELFNKKAGYLAGLLYAIFVSSFFEYYLAVHGEVIFNLPVALAFYLFVLAEKGKKSSLNYFLAGVVTAIAFFTKGHTLLLLVFFAFYLIFIKGLLTKKLKGFQDNIWRLIIILAGFLVMLLVFSGMFYVLGIFEYAFKQYVSGNVIYAFAGLNNFDLLQVIKKVITKVGQIVVVQFPLWLLVIYYLFREKWYLSGELKHLMLLLFLGISFSGIFLGGTRLYNHYFLQYLPALCLIAGYSLTRFIERPSLEKRKVWLVNFFLILPILFFSSWNYANAYYALYNPEKAFPENHAVIPRESYKGIAKWIKNHSSRDDRIFQWGDIIEIYFFSQRKPGIRFLWCSRLIYRYRYLAKSFPVIDARFDPQRLATKKKLPESKQWTFNSQEDVLYSIILDLDKKKPRYIIDTSPINFREFNYPLEDFPVLLGYIKERYNYEKPITVDGMKIYEIRNRTRMTRITRISTD